ncbi:MAG: hypothetical protein H6740_14205 [Alphaproteobacteria bacterium]|nr:hypothetical protein [Alphaproteobacteria bacterium]
MLAAIAPPGSPRPRLPAPARLQERLDSEGLRVEVRPAEGALGLRLAGPAEGAPDLALTLRVGPSPLAGREDPALAQSLELAMATTVPEALLLDWGEGGFPPEAWPELLRMLRLAAPPGALLMDVERLRPLRGPTTPFFHVELEASGAARTRGLARAGLPELTAPGLAPGSGDAVAELLRALARDWMRGARPALGEPFVAPDGAHLIALSPEHARARLGLPPGEAPEHPTLALLTVQGAPLSDLFRREARAPVAEPELLPTPEARLPLPPLALGALSLLLPGVGQIALGQTGKGALMLALTPVTLGLLGLLNLFAAVDATRIARRLERGEPVGPWTIL